MHQTMNWHDCIQIFPIILPLSYKFSFGILQVIFSKDGNAWIEQDVDLLLPCELENQITDDNAAKVSKRVKLIGEGANGPTTPEADKYLESKGIFVIPDFLAIS